jgi:hypothetical protein
MSDSYPMPPPLELPRFFARLCRKDYLLKALAEEFAPVCDEEDEAYRMSRETLLKPIVEALFDESLAMPRLGDAACLLEERVLAGSLLLESGYAVNGSGSQPEVIGAASSLLLFDLSLESYDCSDDKAFALPVLVHCSLTVGGQAIPLSIGFVEYLASNDLDSSFRAHYSAAQVLLGTHLIAKEAVDFAERYEKEGMMVGRDEVYYSPNSQAHQAWQALWQRVFHEGEENLVAAIREVGATLRVYDAGAGE